MSRYDDIVHKFLGEADKKRKELASKFKDVVKKLAKGKDAVEFEHGVAIKGDTMKLLPELKKIPWGLVVWDPPYLQTDGKAEKLFKELEGTTSKENFYGKYIPDTVEKIAPLVHDSMILFGGDMTGLPFIIELARHGVTLRRSNVWLRNMPKPRFTYGESPIIAGEIFYWLGKTGEKATYHSYRLPNVKGGDWKGANIYAYSQHSEYPYVKPRKLLYQAMQDFGNPPVLDPMAGWMTAGLVSERLGLPWVCIEIRPEIFEQGIKRFKNLNKLEW